MRNTIINAFQLVKAPFTAEHVEMVFNKTIAANPSNPKSFAWVSARNLGLDLIKRREARLRMELLQQKKEDAAAAAAARKLVAKKELIALIANARTVYREDRGIQRQLDVLEAFEVLGLSTQEVMSAFGLKQDNAYKRRSRAVALLRKTASPLLKEGILKVKVRKS